MKAELGVCHIHKSVENMQFVPSKLGVRLKHECVLYTRWYGKFLHLQVLLSFKKVRMLLVTLFYPVICILLTCHQSTNHRKRKSGQSVETFPHFDFPHCAVCLPFHQKNPDLFHIFGLSAKTIAT